MNIEEFNKILSDAQKTVIPLSPEDINILLNTNTEKCGGIEGKTLNEIQKEIFDIVFNLECIPTNEEKREICQKLIGHRYISQINQFSIGKGTKSISLSKGKIRNCGILLKTEITNNGVCLLCGILPKFVFKLKYDDHLFFQKLTEDEQIILLLQEKVILK